MVNNIYKTLRYKSGSGGRFERKFNIELQFLVQA